MSKPVIAYCFRNGVIKITDKPEIPDGALEVARGVSRARLRNELWPMSRISYDGRRMIVPGVPENRENDAAAVDALRAFVDWIQSCRARRAKNARKLNPA